MESVFYNGKASWIWPEKQADQVNQYIEFRHEFVLDTPASGGENLAICAECNYNAWVNGEFVGSGQFTDYPDNRTYDRLPIGRYLKKGKNVLAVLANHWGEGHFSYIKGVAGLIYSITGSGRSDVVSSEGVQYRISPCYRQGSMARLTPQLPFTFEYDASGEDQWQTLDYMPGRRWAKIKSADVTPVEKLSIPGARPLPKLKVLAGTLSKVVAQGVFKRPETDEKKTVAELMQTDFLSSRTVVDLFENVPVDGAPVSLGSGVVIRESILRADGVYLVLDLGREETGYLDLEFETSAGTVVDVAFGEHLDDLRVRSSVGGGRFGSRNFAARYICRDGRQKFTHYFTRFAGRYLQLHISQSSSRFALYYAGLLPAEYPLDVQGEFHSPDNLQNKIYEVAVRTLQLCMHEHYEDCPWREQGLYANDSRIQALSGYYCFGDYLFPKVSFSLLGDSLKRDGFLELCAPAEIPVTIPSFSMAWIIAVNDHLLYSGDVEFARQMLPKVNRMMDIYISMLSDDVLPAPHGERYWHFYDWAEGLTGQDERSMLDDQAIRIDAPLNLFFCLALRAAAEMARACCQNQSSERYEACSQKLRAVFHQKFWDPRAGAYQTYGDSGRAGHFAELTQALAICSEVCPAEIADRLAQQLADENNPFVKTTLSQSIYKFEALLKRGHEHDRCVFDKISRDWGQMLFSGATSFWETIKGGWDFEKAGSLCHGWSAIPIYFYQAYLLGITPREPGFKKFCVDPLTSIVQQASGTVPTPYGTIRISWERLEGRILYKLTHPKEIEPFFRSISPNDGLQILSR